MKPIVVLAVEPRTIRAMERSPVVATTVQLPQRDVTVAPATSFYTTDKLGYRGLMDAFQAEDAVYLDASGGLPRPAKS